MTSIDITTLDSGQPGISPQAGAFMRQAAAVCMAHHHDASPVVLCIEGDCVSTLTIDWDSPDEQAKRTWRDMEEATEWGATGIAVLVIDTMTNLSVLERSVKGGGFDYWLGESSDDSPLFQQKIRLEVSGILSGRDADVRKRSKEKVVRLENYGNLGPAIVIVTEFGHPKSRFSELWIQ